MSARVLLVWVYNNAGKSVFAAALFHTTINASWQFFPAHGSYRDPSVVAPIVAVTAAVAVSLWGPRTLVRFRYRPGRE